MEISLSRNDRGRRDPRETFTNDGVSRDRENPSFRSRGTPTPPNDLFIYNDRVILTVENSPFISPARSVTLAFVLDAIADDRTQPVVSIYELLLESLRSEAVFIFPYRGNSLRVQPTRCLFLAIDYRDPSETRNVSMRNEKYGRIRVRFNQKYYQPYSFLTREYKAGLVVCR